LSEFPRGWTLTSATTAGAAATITVPAVPGVVHVLDSLQASLVAVAAAAAGSFIWVTVSWGGFAPIYLTLLASNGGAIGNESASLSGLDIATAPATALTVAFNAPAAANYNEVLLIQGHDI
jgi:hypothetical protein